MFNFVCHETVSVTGVYTDTSIPVLSTFLTSLFKESDHLNRMVRQIVIYLQPNFMKGENRRKAERG
jgi:hypothetical protein